jgi:protein-S-isoprenylcysteine O-methyltransferase Ste14
MDGSIYVFHFIFWGSFLARVLRRRKTAPSAQRLPPVVQSSPLAKPALAILVFMLHGVAFGVMYSGIGEAVVLRKHTQRLFDLPWVIGGAVIVFGAVIIAWALYVFDSWRLLAKLDAKHELCTRGPYGHLRHPIYLACDLLALGSFLWLPTVTTLIGFVAMVITGDWRARREESVLRDTFGDEYRRYEERVRRYIPGVY